MHARGIVSVVSTLVLLHCTAERVMADASLPIDQAVREQKVQANITGLGGSTGDALLLTLRRLTRAPIRIAIPPGTVFKSATGQAQDMVVSRVKGERTTGQTYRPMSDIMLSDEREHSYVLEAYCLDFDKPNPMISDAFRVGRLDKQATAILSVGKQKTASIRAIQCAIWIHRSSASNDQLKRRFPVTDEDIEEARNLLRTMGSSVDPAPSSILKGISPTDQASISVTGNWDQRFGEAQDYTRGSMPVGAIIDLKASGWHADAGSLERWDLILYGGRTFSALDRKNMGLACILLSLGRGEHMKNIMSIESGWSKEVLITTALKRCGEPSALLKHPDGKWGIAVVGPFGLKFNIESGAVTGVLVPCERLQDFLTVLRGAESYASRQVSTTSEEAEEAARLVRQLASATGSDDVRADAAEMLGWTGNPTCIPDLIKGLQDKSEKVVIACCAALQKMPDKRAVPTLIQLIERQDNCWGTLPAMAIHALAKTKDKRAVPVIIAAMRRTTETTNPNAPDFKKQYADYLRELTGHDFGKDIARWQSWWSESKTRE